MEPTAKQPVPIDPLPTAARVALPSGNILSNYGGAIGAVGVGFAIMEFLRDDPHETMKLLGEFGPKYLLFGFLSFVGWDLLKRLLKMFSRAVDHMGALAQNTGAVASAVQDFAGKNDRTADEMRRLCSYSASQSERAVELAKDNNELLHQLVKQGGVLVDQGNARQPGGEAK